MVGTMCSWSEKKPRRECGDVAEAIGTALTRARILQYIIQPEEVCIELHVNTLAARENQCHGMDARRQCRSFENSMLNRPSMFHPGRRRPGGLVRLLVPPRFCFGMLAAGPVLGEWKENKGRSVAQTGRHSKQKRACKHNLSLFLSLL